MGVDEEFAARGFGMTSQDLTFKWWQKTLGAAVGLWLGWDFLYSAWNGHLLRQGFDLWLPYAAVAVGVFIFPRSMRFAMLLLAGLSPIAAGISLVRDSAKSALLALLVGGACALVAVVIRWFRPEPFAKPWPEAADVPDFLAGRREGPETPSA